ncbi:MAG: ECF transporter S component [Christensenellales bacterium]
MMSPKTKKLVQTGMLSAIAAVLFYFPEFPLAFLGIAPWLKIDFSLVPVMIGGFSLGPLAGIVIIAIKDIVGLLHSTSGGIGEIADAMMSLAYMLPCIWLYYRHKTRGRALLGMGAGTLAMTAAALPLNQFILVPLYMGAMGLELDVAKYLWLSVLPFNLVKGAVVSLVTFLLYKRLRNVNII